MEYISNQVFRAAKISSPAEKFFVELWCELFNQNTIDTYRVRVNNAYTILTELSEVIEDYLNESVKHGFHIIAVAEEAIELLERDVICNTHFKLETKLALNYLRSFAKEKPKKEEMRTKFAKCDILKLQLESKYQQLLLQELQSSIFTNFDPEKIYLLTNALATQLVYVGFSLQYLYARRNLFLGQQENESFTDKFTRFKTDISKQARSFMVSFKFITTNDILSFPEIFGIKVNTEFPLQEEVPEFTDQSGDYYGSLEVSAFDPFSAVKVANKKIALLRNVVRYEFRKSDFKLSLKFYVKEDNAAHHTIVNYGNPTLGFLSAGKPSRFQTYVDSLTHLTNPIKDSFDKESTGRIFNSLHYFRLSIDSEESETNFLMRWIAFEYLIKIEGGSTLIEKITDVVPMLFAKYYLSKLLIDLSANFNRIKPTRDNVISSGVTYKAHQFEIPSILNTLRNANWLNDIPNTISSELLKYRTKIVAQYVASSSNFQGKLDAHKNNITRNLYRIYRFRNKIVHSASTHLNTNLLSGHLTYYYTTLYSSVLYLSVHDASKKSLSEIFSAIEAEYELYKQRLANAIDESLLK